MVVPMKSKRYIFNYLVKRVVNPNNSKYLGSSCRTKFYIHLRQRGNEIAWHRITIKGNYIRAYQKNNWEDDNCLILKTGIQDYKSFLERFRELTPDLGWRYD